MKKMTSKFNSSCRSCGERINRGESIYWSRATGAVHEACYGADEDDAEAAGYDREEGEEAALGLEPGTLANDRRLARRGLTVVRFASGDTYTQNSRGRCEDAPCCGCCS